MPASWRTSDLTVLGAAAVGTVLLTAASFFVAPTQALPREDGSSYASHPEGGRAAFLLLKHLGYDVERSFEPLTTFAHTPEDTMLVIASPSLAPSQLDVRALRTFLDRGGVVLATGPMASAFLPGVPTRAFRPTPARKQTASLPSALSSGVAEIEMPAGSALALDSPYLPIYGTHNEPAVLSARFNKGRAVWWAGSTPLLNSGIDRSGHVELLVNAVGPPGVRTVVWDEYYHGHKRSFWSYIAGTPLPIAGLQLGAIASAALLTYSRRRRPVRGRIAEPRTSPLEFIETMAGLYERAGTANAAVTTVYTRVRRRLLGAAGLPVSSSDEQLVAAAAERLSLDSAELSTLLLNARTASVDPNLTSKQAVTIVFELQRLTRGKAKGKRQKAKGKRQT